jgi:hypothetical protein
MPLEAGQIFEASSQSLRQILIERGLGLYIPPYQRPYGWDKDKVTQLLEDIFHGYVNLAAGQESFTFLGTVITIHDIHNKSIHPVVRSDVPAKVLNVIDGQQRLSTILLLCIGLHTLIRTGHAKMTAMRRDSTESDAVLHKWLDERCVMLLEELRETFVEIHRVGDAKLYPRMIRSFQDQWAHSSEHARYTSPIARLILDYANSIDATPVKLFKPDARDGHIEGEKDLVSRFNEIVKVLRYLRTPEKKGALQIEGLPSRKDLARNEHVHNMLLNHSLPEEAMRVLSSDDATVSQADLFDLLLISTYVLNRVAMTLVRCKNEDFAFSVFESLNTTGEPLTAFETFRPKVVLAEGLERYDSSPAHAAMKQVSTFLGAHNVGEPLQTVTRDLLTTFAAAETGEKLSTRLADQRVFLKREFERYETSKPAREGFLFHLRDTAAFMQHAWIPVGKAETPVLAGLPAGSVSAEDVLCLSILAKLKHTVTLAPMIRFYATAVNASQADVLARAADLRTAIRAFTAFSVLWRASRRGTGNIDQQYREVLTGNNNKTSLGPLARCLAASPRSGIAAPEVDVVKLKAELRARLHGDSATASPDAFANSVKAVPLYKYPVVARVILLAAYHDTVSDGSTGLVKKGRDGVYDCLVTAMFNNGAMTLEHIAPQERTTHWSESVYANGEIVDQLGNLVLLPQKANSSLSNRPPKEKRVLYKALGSPTHSDAETILEKAKTEGVVFKQSTSELMALSAFSPQLQSLGDFTADWDALMISARSECLARSAWDRLYAWLS